MDGAKGGEKLGGRFDLGGTQESWVKTRRKGGKRRRNPGGDEPRGAKESSTIREKRKSRGTAFGGGGTGGGGNVWARLGGVRRRIKKCAPTKSKNILTDGDGWGKVFGFKPEEGTQGA